MKGFKMTPTLKGRYEKGTFPEGYYWCRKLPGYGEPSIEIVGISNSYLPSHYEEILAPVPTFEEWQENQLKITREALAFYGDGINFKETLHNKGGSGEFLALDILDRGGIARQALAQMDELKGGK